ncbi:MAG: T9SS type A sorting domain-containing protein [Bacteroidia bacterium]
MKKLYSILTFSLLTIGAFAQCTITSGPNITQNGLMITATGTGTGGTFPGYGYDWGDQTAPGTSQTSTHTYAAPGTYIVCMIYLDAFDPANCIDSSCTTISVVGINDLSASLLNVQTAPNPFTSQLTINLTMNTADMVEVAVYDITGKQVVILKNGMMATGNNVIDWKPAGLTAGVYFLQVKTGDALITKKIVFTQN